MAEFVNRNTGETVSTTDPGRIRFMLDNPAIFQASGGRVDIAVPGGEARSVTLDEAANQADPNVISRQDANRLDRGRVRREQQEMLEGMGAEAGTMAFTDAVGFGLPSATAELLSPGTGDLIRRAQDANPVATGVGTLGGLTVGMLGGGAGSAARGATRLGSLGRILSGSPGGLSVRAGQAARRAVGSRFGNVAGTVADVVAQEAVIGGSLAVSDLAQNRPITVESVLADGGVGVGLGMGFEALLGGVGRIGNRALRAAQATDGAQLLSRTRTQAHEAAEAFSGLSDQAARQRFTNLGELAEGAGPVGRAAGAVADASASPDAARLGQILRSPEARRAINMTDRQVRDGVTSVANRFRALDEVAETTIRGRTGLSQRLSQFDGSLSQVSREAATEAAQAAQSRIQRAAAALSEANPGKLANDLRKHADGLTGGTARQTVEQADAIREALDGALSGKKKLTAAQATAYSEALEAVNTGVLHNDQLLGEFAAAQRNAVAEIGDLRRARKAAAIFDKGGNRNFTEVVQSALKRGVNSVSADRAVALSEYALATRRLGERVGGSAGRKMVRESNDLLSALDESMSTLKLRSEFNSIRRAEAQGAGPANAVTQGASFAGSVIGGAMGGFGGAAVGGALGSAVGAAAKALLRPAQFADFNIRMTGLVERQMARRGMAQGRLRNALQSGKRVAVPRRAVRGGIMSLYNFEKQSPQEREKEFMELHKQLMARNNPQRLMDEISESTEGFVEHDPQMAAVAAEKLTTAHQYLVLNLPPVTFDPLFPDSVQRAPSGSEIRDFLSRVAAIDDPLSIMDRFIEGTLKQNEVEAVKAVYPELFSVMTMDILEVMSEVQPRQVPFQTRIQMQTLLGIPAHSTLTPEFTTAAMNRGNQTTQQAQVAPAPSNIPQGQITSISMTATPNQNLSG